jgi:hypothetical protein
MRIAPDVIAKLFKHDKSIHDEEWILDPETGQVHKIIPPAPQEQSRPSTADQAPVQRTAATFQSSYRTYD